MSALDPSDWLDRFKAAGGCYVATPDGEVVLGYAIDGPTVEQASTLMRRLRIDAEANEAVKAAIIAQARGVLTYG